MALFGSGWRTGAIHPWQTLLYAAFFLLPVLSPPLFGLLNGLLAVPVILLLAQRGFKPGSQQLQASILLAGLIAVLTQRAEAFLFSLTLIPLGYALCRSALAGESPAVSGGKGAAVLALTWLLFWSVFGALSGVNPYTHLLQSLDVGFKEMMAFSASEQAGLSPDALQVVHEGIDQVRQGLPRLLPGILAAMVPITVWANMVVANRLAGRFRLDQPFWNRYVTWRLPDHLVWVPIAAGFGLLAGKGSIQHASLSVLLVASIVYFFQGLAVLLALLERWNAPMYLRVLLYVVLIFQSYGILLLALLGIGDVWINFRRSAPPE